jgi:hypothetical protein
LESIVLELEHEKQLLIARVQQLEQQVTSLGHQPCDPFPATTSKSSSSSSSSSATDVDSHALSDPLAATSASASASASTTTATVSSSTTTTPTATLAASDEAQFDSPYPPVSFSRAQHSNSNRVPIGYEEGMMDVYQPRATTKRPVTVAAAVDQVGELVETLHSMLRLLLVWVRVRVLDVVQSVEELRIVLLVLDVVLVMHGTILMKICRIRLICNRITLVYADGHSCTYRTQHQHVHRCHSIN